MEQSTNKSKGFGFVRFSDEADQQKALIEMQHMTGIGRKPIRVGLAAPKKTYNNYNSNYSSSYNSSNYYNWGGYNYPYNSNYQNQSYVSTV